MTDAARIPGVARLFATIGAGAATLLLGTVTTWEGVSTVPYRDVAGVRTVCYGETRADLVRPGRRYTAAECKALLARRLAEFAGPVLARNPELAGHPEQLAAASSLAYNIGVPAYRRSSVARAFSAGHWRRACDGFLAWSRAGGQQVRGLLERRRAERRMCLTNLPPERRGS